ncbi:MAG: hypothetical protein KIT33_05950 [Candidatus Kapabacteria bacterium]|nr:hypothetical protein [Ignavibacteriota bacterium]MCW5884498.1 hypothetical protein [Candidatus Kapabacteria bacterium]
MFSDYIPFILMPFIWWGVRYKLKKEDKYTPFKRKTLFIGIVSFFLTEIARSFYGPYIYKNDIFDYYLADTLGNSLGTVTAIFMVLSLSGKSTKKDWKIMAIIISGLVGYECLNFITGYPFDFRDVLATLIFGGISIAVYFQLLQKYKKNH